jgi:hypothetical protein
MTDPVTGEAFAVTYNDLIAVTVGVPYAPFIWPDFASLLVDLEQQLSPPELGRRLAVIRTELGLDAAVQEPYPNVVEASPGVTCSDSVNPRSFAAWQSAADSAEARYGRFSRIWNWTWSARRSWPSSAGQDRFLGPWTAPTSSPVLVVGNYFDPPPLTRALWPRHSCCPVHDCCPTPGGGTPPTSAPATSAWTVTSPDTC